MNVYNISYRGRDNRLKSTNEEALTMPQALAQFSQKHKGLEPQACSKIGTIKMQKVFSAN